MAIHNMTIQRQGWNYNPAEHAAKMERMRKCSICLETFTSMKKAQSHKRRKHAY